MTLEAALVPAFQLKTGPVKIRRKAAVVSCTKSWKYHANFTTMTTGTMLTQAKHSTPAKAMKW